MAVKLTQHGSPHPPEHSPRKVLIVSCSARMMAESAARAGIRPVTLDLYADQDTRACATTSMAIPSKGGRFDRDALLAVAQRLAPAQDYPLVYGSGLDSELESLTALAAHRRLLGNSIDCQLTLRSPERFFALLDQCDIPYPEIRRTRPLHPEGWLIKAGDSEGGKQVRFSVRDDAQSGEYYQRHFPGPACSALFLADGDRSQIIGFNTLWSLARGDRPYLFAGALNRAPLTEPQRRQVEGYVARLTRKLAIRGLNSLDFIPDRGRCRVLELNGRPSATLTLHDAKFPSGLMAAHIRACEGHMAPFRHEADPVRAFRVCLAPRNLLIPDELSWPTSVADRPVAGTRIAAGEPLCTLFAEGNTLPQVQRRLANQEASLLERLNPPQQIGS